MDWKLELVAVPVSDVDRAKEFYAEKVGFNSITTTRSAMTSASSSSPRMDRLARSRSERGSPTRDRLHRCQLPRTRCYTWSARSASFKLEALPARA